MSQEVNTVMLSRQVYDEFVEERKKLKELRKSAKVGLLVRYNDIYGGTVTEVVGAEEVYAEIDKKLLCELERAMERIGGLERKFNNKELINKTPKTNWWNVFSKFKEKSE